MGYTIREIFTDNKDDLRNNLFLWKIWMKLSREKFEQIFLLDVKMNHFKFQ